MKCWKVTIFEGRLKALVVWADCIEFDGGAVLFYDRNPSWWRRWWYGKDSRILTVSFGPGHWKVVDPVPNAEPPPDTEGTD